MIAMKCAITTVLILCCLLMAQERATFVRQTVTTWPAGYDTTGIHWKFFNPDNPWIKVLSNTSPNCQTLYSAATNRIRWVADIDNFPGYPPHWSIGDTMVAFGSWDSAYCSNPSGYSNNVNHTGFFWVFSDTISGEPAQTWQPDDTLWLMLKPVVYLQDTTAGNDTIIIEITNPPETRRIGQSVYDVVGYEIYYAYNIGAPQNFVPFVYVPCQGGPGETTTYKDIESNYTNGLSVYFAYKIVICNN